MKIKQIEDGNWYLQGQITHLKRYNLVLDKINQFTAEMKKVSSIEIVDHIQYGRLMEEAHEALLELYKDAVILLDTIKIKGIE